MYLECLLDILNQKLTVDSEKYAGAKYYGLAYQVSRENQRFPVILENKEQKEVVFDDSKPLVVYHRLLFKPYSKNDYDLDIATCQMVMVVYGKTTTGTLNNVENQLVSLFPEALIPSEFSTLTGIESVDFQITSSNLISEDVFNQEYKGVEYRLGEDDFLFSVRYNIDVSFRKDCLDFCDSTYKTFCEQVAAANVTDLLACFTESQTTQAVDELCGDCADGTAVLKNLADQLLELKQVPSGAMVNIFAPNGTVGNSDNSVQVSVLSGGGNTFPNTPIRKSDSSVIVNQPSGVAYNVPDSRVSNSDDSYDVNVKATEQLELPDIDVTDSDGTTSAYPGMKDVVCTPSAKDATIIFNPLAIGDDTSGLFTNNGTAITLTAISDDGGSGTITVSINGGAYAAFVNPTVLGNGDTYQVKRTVTTGVGTVTVTGTYA